MNRPTITIDGRLYGVRFNDDPDCPISVWPIEPFMDLDAFDMRQALAAELMEWQNRVAILADRTGVRFGRVVADLHHDVAEWREETGE